MRPLAIYAARKREFMVHTSPGMVSGLIRAALLDEPAFHEHGWNLSNMSVELCEHSHTFWRVSKIDRST